MNFRLRDYILYPLAIKSHHDFLQKSQYWSSEERRRWTQERLDQILRYAVKNVPYYKRTLSPFEPYFNEMIDNLDLRSLPIITKDIIRKHYKELISEKSSDFRPRMDRTSGSTGTPMQFLLDKKSDINNFAAVWRVLNWTGYKFGKRYASIDTTFEKQTKRLSVYDIKQNCIHLPFVNLNKNNVKEFIKILQKFNPTVIKSYPSALALLCHWIQATGIDYRPKAILTCAEPLLEHQKKTINEILQCPIFDYYGQNERACLVSTCEKGSYHIHEEYSFVELIRKNNQPLISGEQAQIIATTFDNFAMPLIRYQTNDIAVLDHNLSCECGRTYKTIEKVIGRSEDYILTPEGRHVTRMDVPFKYTLGIQEAQIVQKQVDKIEIRIIKSPTFQQKDLDDLLHHLRLRLGQSMEIEFKFINELLVGENGKKKFIISEMSKDAMLINECLTIKD